MSEPPRRRQQTLPIPQVIQQALTLHQQGKRAEAEQLYEAVLKVQPDHFDALRFMGVLRSQQGRGEEAVKYILRALERQPGSAEAHVNLASTLAKLNRHDEAIASYDKALAIKPDHAEALNNRGNVFYRLGRHDEAIASYDKALVIKADYADAHCNRGAALAKLNRFDEALASHDRALAIRPDYVEALRNRGSTLADLGRDEEAVATYDRAIALKGDNADLHYNRGHALHRLHRDEAAVASFDAALALKPDHVEALYNRGIALADLGRFEAAIESYDKALALKPGHPDALNNRGNSLQELNRLEDALASYDKAIAVAPDYAGAYSNRGGAFARLRRFDDAIASFEKTISIRPDYVDAHANRGTVLQQQNRHDEAVASYEKVLALKPDYKYALGAIAYSRAHICDWQGGAGMGERISEAVRAGKFAGEPFALLALCANPADQFAGAAAFVRDRHPPRRTPLSRGECYRHERIRVAYLSADFHEHATAYLMAELFERHDRSRFEITGVSFGPDQPNAMRTRLVAAFDRFVDVRGHSDAEAAKLLREMETDIAVDLKGYTTESRPGILAHRPAPIQVNYLGYPGTMAAEYIDYLIADPFVIPQDDQKYYSEKIAYLPDCYQPNDSKRRIAERTPTRANVGLPERGFVFCCFNNNFKLTPQVFDIWMRLLREVDGSVFWLLQGNVAAEQNLRREARARGVDPGRLIFAPRMKLERHLARHRLADLFLDTLPYNAHTTASDALWTGLPVVTCAGTTFAGRVGTSLLHAIGLPELVTETPESYEALAMKLATGPQLLSDIKEKLERNRLARPLFDADRFRRHIESAYRTMWEIHQRHEAPQTFSVNAINR